MPQSPDSQRTEPQQAPERHASDEAFGPPTLSLPYTPKPRATGLQQVSAKTEAGFGPPTLSLPYAPKPCPIEEEQDFTQVQSGKTTIQLPMLALPYVPDPQTVQLPKAPETFQPDEAELFSTMTLLSAINMNQMASSQTSTRMPIVIRADKHYTQTRLRIQKRTIPLKRRVAWYIATFVCILSIVLGFLFTVPLGVDQSQGITLAQHISNLITNGQFSSIFAHGGPTPTGTHGTPGATATPGVTSTPGATATPTPPAAANGTVFPGSLYSASSPWNVPIGANVQLDPNSSAMASSLASLIHVPTIFNYGMPVYVSTANDPLYTVQASDNAFKYNNPFHIPDTAAPSPASDRWLIIYDSTKNMVFEMWEAYKSGGTWTTQAATAFSADGDGVLQADGSQTGGNGASYLGGVIRAADVARGYINHALSMGTAFTSYLWRYPMSRSDGHGGGSSSVPMGARVQLDPAVDCNGLPNASAGEVMVCKALQTYGGYIRDTSPNVGLGIYFEGEDLNDPNRNPPNGSPGDTARSGGVFGNLGLGDQQNMPDIPWNRLRVLASWNSFTGLNSSQPPLAAAPSSQGSPAYSLLAQARNGQIPFASVAQWSTPLIWRRTPAH